MKTNTYSVDDYWMELNVNRDALLVKRKSNNQEAGTHPIPLNPSSGERLYIYVDGDNYHVVEDYPNFAPATDYGNLTKDVLFKRCFRIECGKAIGIGDIRDCKTSGNGYDHVKVYLSTESPSNQKGCALQRETMDGVELLSWDFPYDVVVVGTFDPYSRNPVQKMCVATTSAWC